MTCHAAIVSRELGIPCVVGTREATRKLRDGELVTVDGREGTVFEGDVTAQAHVTAQPVVSDRSSSADVDPAIGTRLYVNLAIAEHAEEAAALPVDGVGLLRAEFMYADALGGQHPSKLSSSHLVSEKVELVNSEGGWGGHPAYPQLVDSARTVGMRLARLRRGSFGETSTSAAPGGA